MPWDAAVREAREETGLEVEPAEPDGVLAHVDVHPGPRRHTHLDLRYVVHAPDADPAPPAHESQDVQWFQWHRAIAIAEPGLEGILRALQPGEPVLRSARPNDARECAHVYLRSRRFAIPEVPPIHDEADVRRWMADEVIPHEDVTVAEIDGTIVGLMVLGRDPRRRSGWIEQLYLDPAWMGRGLGVRFVERAQAALPEGLQLWTFEANGGARRFYERLGFEAVEHTDGAANEERAPDVHYVWLPASSERDTLRSESGRT
jgi:GNAT superfamily N-acetyltransferase